MADPVMPPEIYGKATICGKLAGAATYPYLAVDAQGKLYVINDLAPGASTEVTLAAVKDRLNSPLRGILENPAPQVWKHHFSTTAQTGVLIWTPAPGKKIAISSLDITAGANVNINLWFGPLATTVYVAGTHQVLFRGDATLAGGAVNAVFPIPRFGAVDQSLKITTDAAPDVYVTLYGYEI